MRAAPQRHQLRIDPRPFRRVAPEARRGTSGDARSGESHRWHDAGSAGARRVACAAPRRMNASALTADRAEALRIVSVSRETLERIDTFVELFLRWQRAVQLVAPADLAKLWTRHVADSLQLIELAPAANRWADLGSGGGFPGLVIALAFGEREKALVHLVESDRRKAAFLR